MSIAGNRVFPSRTGDREPTDEAAPRRPPDVARIVQLQRSAGNQAVARALANRTLQRALSDEFKQRELAQLAWPNVPTAGSVLAIATRAAKTRAVTGVARRLVNEIGEAMKTDQRLELITEKLRSHAADADITDKVAQQVIDTFKRYLAERTPRMDAAAADYSPRDEWAQTLTKPGTDDYRYLVSAIDTSKSYGIDRFRNPWLFNVQAASMSLISPKHPSTYRDFGFIFDVPKECILVAGHDDLGTSNTAYDAGPVALTKEIEEKLIDAEGRRRKATAVDQIGLPKAESPDKKSHEELIAMAQRANLPTTGTPDELERRLWDYVMLYDKRYKAALSQQPKGARSRLLGPEEILEHTGKAGHQYNEVYVAGTSLDGARQIRPSAIFYNADAFARSKETQQVDATKIAQLSEVIQIAKELKLPIVAIRPSQAAQTKPKVKAKGPDRTPDELEQHVFGRGY
jgi:hypothetical protein